MPTVDVGTGPAHVFDTEGDRLLLSGDSIMPDNKYLANESPLVVGEDHASPNIDREVYVVDFRVYPGFVEVRYANNADNALYSAWVPDRHVLGMKSVDTEGRRG